jgi:hypothetical protein
VELEGLEDASIATKKTGSPDGYSSIRKVILATEDVDGMTCSSTLRAAFSRRVNHGSKKLRDLKMAQN